MKTYSKPILCMEKIIDTNEPVFMASSGGWGPSDCWDAAVIGTGNVVWDADGKGARITLQLSGGHDNVQHHCYGEYLIFHFNSIANISGFGYATNADLNNAETLDYEFNNNLARVTARYHGNPNESFGSGALFVYVTGLSGSKNESELTQFIPTDVDIWDNNWRCGMNEHDSVCEVIGHW